MAETGVNMSSMLLGRVRGVRSKLLIVALTHGVARLVVAVVLLLGGGMALDWAVNLSGLARGLLLLIYFGVFGVLAWRGILKPLFNQPDDDTVTLMVERGVPEFRSRLIASLQLSRSELPKGASPTLVRELVRETEALARPRNFGGVVAVDQMASFVALALLLCGAGGVLFNHFEDSGVFLQRALLSKAEYPFKTKLTLEKELIAVPRGENVTITALARGILPATGKLFITYDESADRVEREFPPVSRGDENATYQRVEENVHQSFDFEVVVNDGRAKGRVEVRPRPKVATLVCQQQFPPYTGKEAVDRTLRGLQIGTVLAGSTLKFTVTPTRPLASAQMRVHYADGTDRNATANIVPGKGEDDPGSIEASFVASDSSVQAVSFYMKAEDKIVSQDESRYRLGIIPDKEPEVSLLGPPDLDQVTARAFPRIRFEARDDFGLAKLELRYRIGENPEQTIGVDHNVTTFEWDFLKLAETPPEGSLITYRLVATDNNDVTGPGIGRSKESRFEVVSRVVKEQALLKRADRVVNRINLTKKDQDRARKDLLDILQKIARVRGEQSPPKED